MDDRKGYGQEKNILERLIIPYLFSYTYTGYTFFWVFHTTPVIGCVLEGLKYMGFKPHPDGLGAGHL